MKVQKLDHTGMTAYFFDCPGCGMMHLISTAYEEEYRKNCIGVGRNCPVWGFNDNLDSPTFTPSLLVSGVQPITDEEHAKIMAGEKIETKKFVCHSFIRDGKIEFLSDCTHHLKGQTVELNNVMGD